MPDLECYFGRQMVICCNVFNDLFFFRVGKQGILIDLSHVSPLSRDLYTWNP
jgi:hypothetical protein